MKLWLLETIEDTDPRRKALYCPGYGYVVRAETEAEARYLAQGEYGDHTWSKLTCDNVPIWTDPRLSTCVEVKADGDAAVILSKREDF